MANVSKEKVSMNVIFDAGKGYWDEVPENTSVKIKNDDDEIKSIVSSQVTNTKYQLPEEPPFWKKLRKFKCWCTDEDLKNKVDEDEALVDPEVPILYAKYKKNIIPFLLLGLLLLGLIIGLLLYTNNWFDPNSKAGYHPGKSREEIINDLNAQVRDGEMNVSINNTIEFTNGTLNPAVANIENIANNHVAQKVVIRLDGDDEILYESGAIAPGHYIGEITLNKELAPGKYVAKVTVTGYNQDADFFGNHAQYGAPLSALINLVVD